VARFSFCGLSLGGAVGMWLGANARGRLERLVLAGTSAYFGPPERWIERAEIVRADGMEPLADATMGRWFTPAFTGVAAFREMLVATPPEGYAACCDALGTGTSATSSARSRRGHWARRVGDPATPPDHAQLIADGSRRATHGDPRRCAPAERQQPEALTPPPRTSDRRGGAVETKPRQPTASCRGWCEAMSTPQASETTPTSGDEGRREVLGDAHVDRATESATAFTADFQELITKYAWGEIWSRPGLDRKTRSCITLAALVALGRDHELPLHVRAALRNGLTVDEIKEVLLHTAVYAGVPAANSAFAIAQRVLEEDGAA
jgi:3-oxoadipate enol-lactonase/4-carboxymuconolactone decarboxylase